MEPGDCRARMRRHLDGQLAPPAGDLAAGMHLPSVVLTGRPNVGKSSIFNRIVGAARAVVEAEPGVTRDRVDAMAEWDGHHFRLTDTGGLGGGDLDPFAPEVARQAQAALAAADVVLFVVDARAGIVPADAEIARQLRRLRRPVVLLANKAEGRSAAPYEFYALGLGEPFPASATLGEGLGDALDAVCQHLGRQDASPAEAEAVPVALVGRPNAGKSSLVNWLVGAERMIVSEVAGTTRDAVDVPWSVGGRQLLLVDTPGLRRPARVARASLEHWTARRSTNVIARAQVAVLVLDASLPCTDQDKRIAGLMRDRWRAAVVVLNKADLLAPAALAEVTTRVQEDMPFLHYAAVVACSARTGWGTDRLGPAVLAAADAFGRRLGTAALNARLREAIAMHQPASDRGESVRIYYAAQVRTAPPTIALVTNRRGAVSDAYVRYLENRLRERFPLEGAPVRWVFRARAHRRLHVPGGQPSAHPRTSSRPRT